MSGILYICATPIGNLDDITLRALEVLKKVTVIAAEDTRHSRQLLNHFAIETLLTSYHEHNKYEKAEALIRRLLSGEDVALISDAGTPEISDPGEVLVQRAIEEGVRVVPVPGACALITALTMSGISGRRFAFEGFLPAENRERRELLEELKPELRTLILYEAPHRLKETLKELYAVLGDRRLAVCRELTKLHEEALQFTLSEAVEYYETNEPRGEFVLVIEGRSREQAKEERAAEWQRLSLEEHMEFYISQGLERKEAMKKVAADRGISRRDVYNQLLKGEDE